MGKYISLGEYNKFYNHICFFLITKIIYEYFLNSFFVEKVELLKEAFPKNVLIQGAFNYFGLFIFSIFLYKYETKQKKGGKEKPIHYGNSDNSYDKNFPYKKSEKGHSSIDLIYNDLLESKYISLSDLMVIVLLYFCIQIFFHFTLFQLRGLDYWMFEILFIALIFSKL